MPSKKVILLVSVILAVLFLAGISAYLRNEISVLQSLASNVTAPPSGQIAMSHSIVSKGVFSYNNSGYAVGYATFRYNLTNSSTLNVTLSMYKNNPFESVVLLNLGSTCEKCFDELQLYSSMLSDMQAYGLLRNASSLRMVSLFDIGTVPDNSLIVVPSGIMPTSLLPSGSPNQSDNATILSLMEKGDTIIYVGQNFSKSITNGVIYLTPQGTLDVLGAAGLGTAPSAYPQNATATRLQFGTIYFNSPTFSFMNGSSIGPVTYANYGNGTILALSNYPTDAYVNASAEASDISRIIASRAWMRPVESGSVFINGTSHGITTVFASNSPVQYASASAVINSSYSLLTFTASNVNGSSYEEAPISIRYNASASVGMPRVIGATDVVPVYIKLSNPNIGSRLFYLDIYDQSLNLKESLPVGFFNASLVPVKYTSFALPSGYYVASLRDSNDTLYGSALFYEAGVVITPVTINFKNGTFVFSAESNGRYISGVPYTASINNIYRENGTVAEGLISYLLPKGTVISYGQQSFAVSLLNYTYYYSARYSGKSPIPPFYLEFGIAVFVILLLNLIIKTPVRDEYYVDVPEFSSGKKAEAKTDANTILNIFDTVNYRFHWRYMPLTPEEVKTGISGNVRYNNMPIAITLQNTAYILDRLVSQGKLLSASNYYAPKRWVDAANHDIAYLVIFRKLRDYCVEHAILFTDLDTNDNADMVITRSGSQSQIFIQSGPTSRKKIKMSKDQRAFLVFLDEESRAEFTDRLYFSYGEESELLKMGVSYSTIKMIDTNNLDQLLF